MRCNLLIDVCLSREVLGITADVDVIGVLVDTDVVDLHSCRESQVLKIDESEVPGHPQVDDEVLGEGGLLSAIADDIKIANAP